MASPEIMNRVEQWMKWDRNEKTRHEVQREVDAGDAESLVRRFGSRIAFGTAGLRGAMTAGISMMNDVVIIQTSQGLCSYVEKMLPDSRDTGIVVGYDGRHNSERWAYLTAAAFLRRDIPVHLFSVMVPTPYVAYAVKHFKTACGIVITASHNPKDDNGYKVYWNNAAQIISPHDKEISQHILRNLELDDASWDISVVANHSLRKDPLLDIDKAYYSELENHVLYKEQNASRDLRMVYTAMHGVGWRFIKMTLDTFGFKSSSCVPVRQQIEADPEFPTVSFPNPEEGKSALDLAIKTAEENSITLILANDPDADRLAIAEKNTKTGEWKILNGNEIGALLGWWCWSVYKAKNPDASGEKAYMMASTVSSKILLSMAETEGFNFIETLTGFKWMGNKARELEANDCKVLFSFEEAIGFMIGTLNYDKDGVTALGVAYEMAAQLHSEGRQLHEQLDLIYEKYGHHVSYNSYYICYDHQKIRNIFDRMRTYKGVVDSYPDEIMGMKVSSVRDLTTGFDNQQPNNKAILPVSSSSQMITFTFANNTVLTLRTSGTEPKIKYYSEIRQKGVSREELEETLKTLVDAAVLELLQPTKNELQVRRA